MSPARGHTHVRALPGDDATSVVLHVPHAGRHVPEWVRERLLLDDAELAAELEALTDHHTDTIALGAAGLARQRPFALVNEVSRFVVDPERFPDEREEMAAVGMAAVYTHGTRRQRIRADDPHHRDELLAAFYEPWADAARAAVDERLRVTGRAVLVDVHSYPAEPLPYELHADGHRPAVCLGTDPAHTPPWLVDAARSAFAPLGDVTPNTPFSGCYIPLAHHGVDRRVHAIMIELRRDTHRTSTDTAVACLTTLIDAL
ncbi:N-formylglutamate amidohydrolase [Actinomycetes bacterium KLBMP 9759]